MLQETSTAGLTALTICYVVDNILLLLISLSFKPTTLSPAFTLVSIVGATKIGGERYPCPEQYASWIERAFFTWGDPLIQLGFSRPFTHADVWDFCLTDYTAVVTRQFHATLTSTHRKHTFLIQLVINFRHRLGNQLVWAIAWCCLSFVGPLGLERTLHFIKNKDTIPVGMLVSTVAYSQMLWSGCRTAMHIRGLVLGEMYSKVLRRKDKAGQALKGQADGEASDDNGGGDGEKKEEETFTNGAVNNKISIDTNELAQTSNYSHDIVILVLQIILTTIFLYRILG
ncbi:hypothetical protein BGZ95_009401 [Linnemannia exigua]|uniref:Uncharacterized protein n=1 Tax=Linnemannia exigua TaxID=604196 RepID=A0AAD4DCX1_9FUNG|nr:hypothetical protein BGZ95_009401 [Linnemannia exigua]